MWGLCVWSVWSQWGVSSASVGPHHLPASAQVYVDEVRFFGRAITKPEVQAEAAPALGGIPPSFTQLGYSSCPLAKAKSESCPDGMHLCTEMELHSGAYQVRPQPPSARRSPRATRQCQPVHSLCARRGPT